MLVEDDRRNPRGDCLMSVTATEIEALFRGHISIDEAVRRYKAAFGEPEHREVEVPTQKLGMVSCERYTLGYASARIVMNDFNRYGGLDEWPL
jgi:hypothetical protein